jgi:hypothetical protein
MNNVDWRRNRLKFGDKRRNYVDRRNRRRRTKSGRKEKSRKNRKEKN